MRDFDRGLNDRGRRGAALMGQHIREHAITWELALASPAERVRRTIEATGLDLPIRFEDRAYLATASVLVELLQRVEGDPGSVLLLGHNPGLQELIFDLVSDEHENALFAAAAEKYPTAAFAVLELEIERWSECTKGCGRLVHFARPRDLDATLGPETVDERAGGLR